MVFKVGVNLVIGKGQKNKQKFAVPITCGAIGDNSVVMVVSLYTKGWFSFLCTTLVHTKRGRVVPPNYLLPSLYLPSQL